MTWVINGLLVWFFTYALTAKIRLQLTEEKEARRQDEEEFKLELYKRQEEIGRIEEEFAEYKKMIGEVI